MCPERSAKIVTIDCEGRAWPWPHLHDFAETYVKREVAKKMLLALELASKEPNISDEARKIIADAIWEYKE